MTHVKICGLTRPQDIAAVNAVRPDFAGFVFAPSRRQVTPQQAAALRQALAPEITPVGVFVNSPVTLILRLLHEGTISIAQLHGQESDDDVAALQQTGCPVIRAFRVESAADIFCALECPADFLLLDSGAGGTGTSFDWSLVPAISRPWFLAGGLNPDNAADAVQRLHPWGLDVSSGVETGGKKDSVKIATFMRRVQNV